MTDFAVNEFNNIRDELWKADHKYSLELVLRVKNFKSQTPIKQGDYQTWEAVLEVINEAFQEPIIAYTSPEKLDGIYGIGVPTASVLLAAFDPTRFAIIDEQMFTFFQNGDACSKLKLVFKDVFEGVPEGIFESEFDNNEELRNWLRLIKVGFEFSKSGWEKIYEQYEQDGQKTCAYSCYLKVLDIILQIIQKYNKQDFPDLRSVELKIWQWRKNNPKSDL